MQKERLDVLLVKKGFFASREKARSSVMAGVVYVNNQKEDKPGARFEEDSKIEVRENVIPYVSRGGLKLEKAIQTFHIVLQGKTAIDIGASTGGFTDCMLKNGAKRVVAVDVGYGQLAWELRQDERVKCMERTNIRYVKEEDIGGAVDFGSVDVSFISLTKVIPVAKELISPEGELLCLIKPQFEAGKDKVGKNGVVRDPSAHREVLEKIVLFALGCDFYLAGLSYSPIKGPEGNIEYLCYLTKAKKQQDTEAIKGMIDEVVAASHQELNKKAVSD